FSVAGQPVRSGKVWLYYYGWDYVETYTLGTIQNGLVGVSMSDEIVRNTIKPPDNWEHFVVVVEVPGVGWYRSPDLEDFVRDTVTALDRLGTFTVRGGVHVVDLPLPVRQRIRTFNQDGTPRPFQKLTFEMYVSE